jgi:hypothetical protein
MSPTTRQKDVAVASTARCSDDTAVSTTSAGVLAVDSTLVSSWRRVTRSWRRSRCAPSTVSLASIMRATTSMTARAPSRKTPTAASGLSMSVMTKAMVTATTPSATSAIVDRSPGRTRGRDAGTDPVWPPVAVCPTRTESRRSRRYTRP